MAIEKILLPDFGEVKNVIVVELFVALGDVVEKDSSLMSLESDKAVMDLPCPFDGVIKELYIKEEDEVNTGDLLGTIEVSVVKEEMLEPEPVDTAPKAEPKLEAQKDPEPIPAAKSDPVLVADKIERGSYHATPSVRAYARELDINLSLVVGTGPKGRIQKSDVQSMIKSVLSGSSSLVAREDPLEDFSKYGAIEEVKMGWIKRISGPHLHKSWTSIPHVTHFDEAEIDELDQFRKKLNKEAESIGIKYSPLVFVIKALVVTLKQYPQMNSSLVPGGSSLILKKYYNIGIAVDTPQGLVVPVIKNADEKGIKEISEELISLSFKAREGKLSVSDLQGATFTISSLGGIGGTAFTPIINSPQVAILGLSKSSIKPVWNGESFVPRLILPLSLSYDHRVIDGAEAARFSRSLVHCLEDLKRILI